MVVAGGPVCSHGSAPPTPKCRAPTIRTIKIQGEYSGKMKSPEDGQEIKLGVQIIALGRWKVSCRRPIRADCPAMAGTAANKLETDGEIKDGVAVFPGEHAAEKSRTAACE